MSDDFIVSSDSGKVHTRGDNWCKECSIVPVACTCGGLIHYEFSENGDDGNPCLVLKCDKCIHDFAKGRALE